MSHQYGVNLFRDLVVKGDMTMEAFARTVIRMDGSAPGPPCLNEDEGARIIAAPEKKGQQELFAGEEV